MVVQTGAQHHVHFVGEYGKDIGTQVFQYHVENGDDDESHHQHVQCGKAFVYQHLINDDLGEQRGDQGEDLEQAGGYQHFVEEALELPEYRQEPLHVETPWQLAQLQLGGHQERFPVPLLSEVFNGDDDGAVLFQAVGQELLIIIFHNDNVFAVHFGNKGLRQLLGRPLFRRVVCPFGFKFKFF